MKYFPSTSFNVAQVLGAEQLNQELRAGLQVLNRLDRENFDKDAVVATRMVANACNIFFHTYQGGTVTYDIDDVGRGWFDTGLALSFTSDEGMLRGAFSGTLERYPDGIGEAQPWKAGVFVDGELVAETDFIYVLCTGINLSFVLPSVPGIHRAVVAFKGQVPGATTGGPTANSVFSIIDSLLWVRNAKR